MARDGVGVPLHQAPSAVRTVAAGGGRRDRRRGACTQSRWAAEREQLQSEMLQPPPLALGASRDDATPDAALRPGCQAGQPAARFMGLASHRAALAALEYRRTRTMAAP